ncbi:MAG: hypothetical protein ABI134_32035 [Byssovorax sp.]
MANVTKKKDTQTWSTVFNMPLEELERRVASALVLMQQIADLFPGLLVMTDEERRFTNGRFKSGEGPMFLTIISVMEAFPAFFEGLADFDEGVDPTKVETPLMRDRIQRAEILAKLLAPAAKLAGMSDTVLQLRGLVRDPIKEAYGIAKSLAKTNAKLKSMLAPVIDYYAAIARAGAATRKANAEAGDAGAKG